MSEPRFPFWCFHCMQSFGSIESLRAHKAYVYRRWKLDPSKPLRKCGKR